MTRTDFTVVAAMVGEIIARAKQGEDVERLFDVACDFVAPTNANFNYEKFLEVAKVAYDKVFGVEENE